MDERTACQRCGTPLSGSPVGQHLCPRCLLGLGLEYSGDPQTGGDRGGHRAAVAARDHPGQIGPYRILEVLGQGGMGIVYLAEQDEPIRRRVALKVIKLGMDTREVVARFASERQALSLMSHPNIARVLDAGASEDGRPYFAMEYVPGLSISDYCDRQRFSTRDRLALFLPVCHAVQHAHQKGIIHRDLKPSNVLVTEEDGKPVPKVIDFGIAKAIHQPLVERAAFTRHGVLIGTPEYMSPEQAEANGLEVDTTTDIYSLGVIVYELLVGALPFDGEALRKLGYAEILRVIREQEPERPSLRITTQGAGAEALAQRHQTSPAGLERQVRGDLDAITMKALEKDRTRRYASASEFAADLQRYLAGEAVVARPASVAYRTRKFIRRHKAGVAAAALVAAALLLGLVTSTALLVRARQAESAARLEARRNALDVDAIRAAAAWDAVTYIRRTREALALERQASAGNPRRLALYMTNLVSIIEDIQDGGDGPDDRQVAAFGREIDVEAIGLLVAAAPADDPGLRQAVALMTDYAERRRPESRLALMRKSVRLWECASAPDAGLLEARKRLVDGLLWEGRRLMAAGRPADALPVLQDASELWKKISPSWGQHRRVQGALGACQLALKRYPEAETNLLAAFRVLNQREQAVQLVDLYRRWGRPEEARRYDQAMLVESVRDVGPLPPWGSIVDRGGGYSARHEGRTIWLFSCHYATGRGSTPRNVAGNTWSWSQNDNAAGGVALTQVADRQGRPAPLLRLTNEEQAKAAADPLTELSIELGPMVADPARHRSLVVYSLLTNPKGNWNHDWQGTSIAVWTDGTDGPVRPVVRRGGSNPTLLFQGSEPRLSAGAVVVGDNLYLFATKPTEFIERTVLVARAPLTRCLERGAWRYYAGSGKWVENWAEAVEVMRASTQLTVHWNAHLRKYLAVTSENFANGIELRTADRPEGPWSGRQVISSGVEPYKDESLNSGALGHGELARDGGRVEYLTYRHPVGAFSHELRLLQIVLR